MTPYGISNLLAIRDLPKLKPGVRAHYEGSIDKLGGNADWDWWLYPDARGEWVLFDVDGPGCIYNFVQHRYPSTEQPTFRFYFDSESTPRFEITPEEFGGKFPFVEPLAGYFLGDDAPARGRGPIRVVRSFVPMPFAKSCRITSSIKLQGNDRSKGEGGWGHVIYHAFASDSDVETFTGKEDLNALLDLCGHVGQLSQKPSDETEVEIPAGQSAVLLNHRGAGAITSLALRLLPYEPQSLSDLWIRLRWDDHASPDVEAPIGAFFGNEYGLRSIALLLYGRSPDGRLYCQFPMPFWSTAKIELHNRGTRSARVRHAIQLESTNEYQKDQCGYLRTTPYYPDTPVTTGRDSIIGEVRGAGHIVAATLTGRSVEGKWVSCEGDVRLYIDGNRTPQIESDGSESHACFGWGFVSPGQQNPFSGYDGSGEPTCEFSETRSHLGDWIPFQTGFTFCLEAHERNNLAMRHSGLILYYGVDEPGMTQTDSLDISDAKSEADHQYRVTGDFTDCELESAYEGNEDTVLFRDRGRSILGRSELIVRIDPQNVGVRLRRRSDQSQGRQRARVFIDGQLVSEREWYFADRNPHYRWLDDEFDLPPSYTQGKSAIRITIERVSTNPDGSPTPAWSEFRYDVFSLSGPLSPRERDRVRADETNDARSRKNTESSASPHPGPLPEGEGVRHQSTSATRNNV